MRKMEWERNKGGEKGGRGRESRRDSWLLKREEGVTRRKHKDCCGVNSPGGLGPEHLAASPSLSAHHSNVGVRRVHVRVP